jgi:ornithine cyclodeaminase
MAANLSTIGERTAQRYLKAWRHREQFKTDRIVGLSEAYGMLTVSRPASPSSEPRKVARPTPVRDLRAAAAVPAVRAGQRCAVNLAGADLKRAAPVRGDWLAPGSHLDLIGSFTPTMREADDACFQHARVFVDTDEALQKSGDLIGPLSRGVLRADEVRGTLTTLCKGMATGRKTASERTVFKSVGTALEDLAAAVQVFEAGR